MHISKCLIKTSIKTPVLKISIYAYLWVNTVIMGIVVSIGTYFLFLHVLEMKRGGWGNVINDAVDQCNECLESCRSDDSTDEEERCREEECDDKC